MSIKVAQAESRPLFGQKVEDYKALVKFRLNLLVVFTAAIGYVLGSEGSFSWLNLLILCLGGFFITGAANALNQVLEKDYDKLMKRTENRPLPTGRMTISEAVLAAGFMSLIGITLLASFNPLTALVGTISLIIYAFVYTPVKRISPIAVLIGAIPGALPPMIGWVAATGEMGMGAIILFSIQFFWQFPHFWAIAWLGFEDYAKAGYFLLPSQGGRDKNSAFQCLVYASFLIPFGIGLVWLGFIAWLSGIIVSLLGVSYTFYAYQLYKTCETKEAKNLMFASFFYLPITMIVLLLEVIL